MTFVYPLLLGGLLLAGLPVLLHFLIRQKPKSLLFPAFRFLIQKRRSNTRSLRLRHLLLLLLRIGLIVLVCLALARPRLFHEQLGILDRERPVAMILVFDTTPSMDYKSGEQTRLDLAKKRALELIDELPADSRYLVIDVGDPASAAREDFVASADKARARIQNLAIQPRSVPVTPAIDRAFDRFETWDDPLAFKLPRFVCVFTDRTKASWAPLPKRPVKDEAIKVRTLLFDVGIDEPTDFAILQADLPSERQTFLQGERIPLRVVVKATGKNASNTLVGRIAGKDVGKQSVDVPAGEARTLLFDISTDKLPPGYHQIEVVEPTPDALAFDNQRFVTFSIQKQPKVLVLADDLKSTKRFANDLEDLRYAVDHKTPENAGNLGDYEAVFLVSVAAPSDKIWQALKAYAAGGGSVAVIPGGDELRHSAYTSEAALEVLPATIGARIDSKQGAIASWDLLRLEHSFAQPMRAWAGRGNVEFIEEPRLAFKYWSVQDKDKHAVVFYNENKNPAVLERRLPGKVLLLTTPLDERTPEWNDYGKSLTTFRLALTYMCARYLCIAAEQQALNFEFGVQQPTVMKSGKPFAKYLLTIGAANEEITFDSKNIWRGERLTKAGNYTIFGQNPDEKREEIARFSVNTPSAESDLSRVPKDEIEASLGPDSVVPQDRKTPLTNSLNWNEPLELFPWLMILLLFLLAFENLLANRFYRQEPAGES